MHNWDPGWHMGWMAIWWLGAPVMIALLLWAATRGRGAGPRDESPEQILKRRYAKGEIDHEAYQRALADLRG